MQPHNQWHRQWHKLAQNWPLAVIFLLELMKIILEGFLFIQATKTPRQELFRQENSLRRFIMATKTDTLTRSADAKAYPRLKRQDSSIQFENPFNVKGCVYLLFNYCVQISTSKQSFYKMTNMLFYVLRSSCHFTYFERKKK